MFQKKISLLFFLLLFLSTALAQNLNVPDSIIVIPNKDYEAGWFHRFWFGDHWRELWTTPLKVEVLNLETFAGGLTAYKKGGGFSTNSLRLKGNDGRTWKFRSVDKDFGRLIPDSLHVDPFVGAIKDQTSSICPMAPLVVVPILNELGILQAEPKLVWMPDDERLGEFRDVFGGMLGMIEIHPDEGIPEFEDAEKVMGTFKLFNRLEEKRNEQFDKLQYLKARLIDIFLGDWDRHTDQWRWAKYNEREKEIWKPIPRDRDEAFSRFDGLLPRIAEYYIPQFVHFDKEFKQIEDLTWSGRFLDRRILQQVTKDEWDSVTSEVVTRLTDQLIETAVARLPREHYARVGEELEAALKLRRNKLKEESEKYYELVNKYIDVFASNKNDLIILNRLDDYNTEIKLFKLKSKTFSPEGNAYFYKMADNNLTRQIRVYLLDGNDRAVVKGCTLGGPIVRIIGGKGNDEMIDSSEVRENLLGLIPLSIIKNKTFFYDSDEETSIIEGAGTVYDDSEYKEPEDDFEKYEPELIDRGHDLQIHPEASYNTDIGLVFGFGPRLYSYDFRIAPYAYRQTLVVQYAALPKSYRVTYEGIFNNIISGASLIFELEKNELMFTNYYGYGNETIYNSGWHHQDYYRVEQELLHIEPRIEVKLNKHHKIGLGVGLNVSETESINEKIIDTFYDPDKAGRGIYKHFYTSFRWRYNGRDVSAFAHRGFYLALSGKYSPKVFDNNLSFFKAGIDSRFYLPCNSLSSILSLRVAGEKIWGHFPYFEASFLGGAESLRGYANNRFSGDAQLFGQMEIRSEIGKGVIILPAKYGVNLLFESGRVFARHEDSDKWHLSYGGGFWISFVNYDYTLVCSLARSPEGDYVYFNFGMGF